MRFCACSAVIAAVAVLPAVAAAGFTNNIMITGYWPPTNEMLRPWSTNPAQNPDGWIGGNWEGRGYNVYSYFPEFPDGLGKGEGDFEVDYQDTSADWEKIVNTLKPAAIITFSRANTQKGWELEGGNRMYASSEWSNDYLAPTKPGAELPIMQALSPGTELFSSLPIEDILIDVAASGADVDPFATEIDDGKFLSNYIGLHANWYHSMHSGADAEYRNFAAGHIHVGMNTDPMAALLATEVTLRSLTDYLDSVIPAPSSVAALLGVSVLTLRRRR